MNKNEFICCLMIDFKDWASNQTQLTYEGTCTNLNTTIDINSFNTSTCIIPGKQFKVFLMGVRFSVFF